MVQNFHFIVAGHKADGQVEADVDRDSTQWITDPEEPNSGPQMLQGNLWGSWDTHWTHQPLSHLHSSSYSSSHLLRPSNSFLLQISVLILV